ncbi:tRNA-uridine aminocarboxypropyltransferase [Pelagicoccus sp. SDUM812005]|uniref:tRNA-uridine aminocarboxypropyltransferase n=1 Tax=Pelagicoccus sp. SDUM812005 TaxID=3041257 RepID=UPI00280D4253|nr:tRNA-uridine aminocarboxypropyltransferase [Pelagicoccus sp. SDUM812005]MDQ8179867.1 DTW domain-containing protein [Pelagicoccus sp. SDUM812005]
MCYKCNRPQQLCWCERVKSMGTRTKFVILMHPYEYRRIKLNTGRLTHLCLADSELYVGETFDDHEGVQALIEDPANYPALLYPGQEARDLSKGELQAEDFAGKRLVVFLLDGTWRLVRPMLRFSESLQRLPKVMFSNAAPSRYVIKRQPEAGCLSTLEAAHELLLALDRSGLGEYKDRTQMLDLFLEMQAFQVKCEQENRRPDFVPRSERRKGEARYNPSKRRKVFPKE